VLFKAPITTPLGGGYKSLNVTIRKTLGLFANVRPCCSLAPFVKTHFPKMDVVIVRENEEGLYAGIEHRQTNEVYQCLKLVSRLGCEQIIRYAFEYARQFNRKKVSCFSKDNIMKMTDGLFHTVFKEIAALYPEIESDHYIIDIGTALVASNPELFDVIVTSNLYGDIISDVAAQVVGSVGLAGSANIGRDVAMFEAIHGSAPDIAGQDIANPSGLINGAVQMLIHIDQPETAALILDAWHKTLEDGIHTSDIFDAILSKQQVGTKAFAQAVIERLGQRPSHFPIAAFNSAGRQVQSLSAVKKIPFVEKRLVGVDVFVDSHAFTAQDLGDKLSDINSPLQLEIISCRGVKVWPNGRAQTAFGDHCICRFQLSVDCQTTTPQAVIDLQQQLIDAGFDVIKTENLYYFGQERGFTLAQGQ
jgi:isocitrate dehydrogenase